MAGTKPKRLGERLVDKGVLTSGQVEEALKIQVTHGGRIGTNLLELQYLSLDELAQHLSAFHRCPDASDEQFRRVSAELLQRVPKEICARYRVFPLDIAGNKRLYLAMADPEDLRAIDDVSFALGLRIEPYSAPEVRLAYYLEERYGIMRNARMTQLEGRILGAGWPSAQRGQMPAPDPTLVAPIRTPVITGEHLAQSPAPPETSDGPPREAHGEPPSDLLFLDEALRSAADDFDLSIDEDEVAISDRLQARVAAAAGPSSSEPARALTPITLDALLTALERADSPPALARALVKPVIDGTALALVLRVKGEFALGLQANGTAADPDHVKLLTVNLALDSTLQRAFARREVIRGRGRGDAVVRLIGSHLALPEPPQVCVAPIVVGGRVVNLLYLHAAADGAFGDQAIDSLRRLAEAASLAYVRLIALSKARALRGG